MQKLKQYIKENKLQLIQDGIIFTIIILSLIWIYIGNAQSLEEAIPLKTTTDKIVNEEFYENPVTKETDVKYFYTGKQEPVEEGELRTTNARIYDNHALIYPGDTFYFKPADNLWYSLEAATTTADNYAKIVAFQKPTSFIKTVLAQTLQIYASYDGEARNYTPSSADFTDFTNATGDEFYNDSDTSKWYIESNSNNFTDYRKGILKFDLSDIDHIITTSTIHLFDSNFKGDTISMGQYSDSAFTISASTYENIDSADYQECTKQLITNYIPLASLGTSQYNEWTLNSTGLDIINASSTLNVCFLPKADIVQYDISTTPSAQYAYVFYNTIEKTGTDYDPYLYVEWTIEETGTTTATTTETYSPGIDGFDYSDDLSIVTGMRKHYETSSITPDWIEYDYYHIPMFVWVILLIPTLWIGSRIIIELLIRWR